MDIVEAINQRKSIRSFKPDPIPKKVMTEILTLACRAPSSVNQQPWEFAVVSGPLLETIKQKNIENLAAGVAPQRDYPVDDRPKDSVYRKRQVDLAVRLFQIMDIDRDDRQKRWDWLIRGFRYFDAPCAIFIFSDKCLSEVGSVLDIGAAMQNICLSALKYGLGTCIENQGIQYSNMLRDLIGIPESKRIAVSIAIGYPDWDFPANGVVTEREPANNITLWKGFE
jgi:nitroreductase